MIEINNNGCKIEIDPRTKDIKTEITKDGLIKLLVDKLISIDTELDLRVHNCNECHNTNTLLSKMLIDKEIVKNIQKLIAVHSKRRYCSNDCLFFPTSKKPYCKLFGALEIGTLSEDAGDLIRSKNCKSFTDCLGEEYD